MRKTVTSENVKRLYQFTRQHYVEYFDLQSELVDHLANAIEEEWQNNPEEDFEEVLLREFKKFGVFGFSDIVSQRKKSMKRKYRKLVIEQFYRFINFPKTLLFLSTVFCLYLLVENVDLSHWIYLGGLLFILGWSMVSVIKIERRYKKRVEESGRKWLLEKYIYSVGSNAQFLNLIIQFYIFIYNMNINAHTFKLNSIIVFLLCFVALMFMVICYISVYYLPKYAERYLTKVYPEYRMIDVV